jgi:uncharacterized protein YlzI (FlbEa/FlbD family)
MAKFITLTKLDGSSIEINCDKILSIQHTQGVTSVGDITEENPHSILELGQDQVLVKHKVKEPVEEIKSLASQKPVIA